ncbi:hypothetical protein [Virgisporangium ochraceum]|uniref:Uncharacterized protein n=1 Tax=Virgisporangium ochraceum TaxID=65505 RepID=A0A8J4EEY1_9ACTN|nr:hypothetical protein [Virgisporangium ochraceum]GIJ72191.1 hypothetical protein Voc01_071080 [Virgisporangium ochraceum]
MGLWSGLPPAQARAQQRGVADGGYPFTCAVLDDMTFFADGEALAEGDVEDMLRGMAPALRRFGVDLRVQTVSDDDDGYVVDISGRRCPVLDADDRHRRSAWLLATVRPLAVVDDLLVGAGAPVRVHTLHAGGNEGLALLLDPAVVEVVRASGLVADRDLPEPVRPHRRR